MMKIIKNLFLVFLFMVIGGCARADKCIDPGDSFSVMKLSTYHPKTTEQEAKYDLYHLIVSSPRVPCDITTEVKNNGEILIYSYLLVVEPEGVAIFSIRIANDLVPEVNEFIDQDSGKVDVAGLMELKQVDMYIERSGEQSDKEMIVTLLLDKLDIIVDRTVN